MRRLIRSLVWLAILGPPLFFVGAVQHGALTHPFSDYCTLIPLFDKLHAGALTFSDLLTPLNQNRPATWRALLLANAWLTGWDIRSEYLYVLAALIGAFLVQVHLLRCACAPQSSRRLSVLVATLSLVSFSPAAHNNHWWSMLLQFDLGHFFIVIAFALVSLRPHWWRSHLCAAFACWLATYTVTVGLVAFASCVVLAQLSSRTPRRFNPRTLFWAANFSLALVFYVPGLPDLDRGLPSLDRWMAFVFAYLGSPIVGLLWFPYRSQFDLPDMNAVTANVIAGLVLVILLGVKARAIIRTGEQATSARAFAVFAIFALGSAVLTGLGRAEFGEYGVANANASRFVLFGSYGLYAALYAALIPASSAPFLARPALRTGMTVTALVGLALASVSYGRSWKVYGEARRFDRLLAAAYADAERESPLDTIIYPEPQLVPHFKSALKRLRAGPYRDIAANGALERLAANKEADEFGVNGLRAAEEGLLLFAHPHSRHSIDLSRAVAVRFRYGVMPNALNATPPTDGVEFRVLAVDVDTERLLWSAVWRPLPGTAHDQHATVALPRHDFSGTLIFETLTAGRSESDWAYWADLTISGFD